MSRERSLEIKNWLTKRITVEEAEALLGRFDDDCEKWGIPRQWLADFNQVFRSEMQPDDDLWLYDSGLDSWADLCGEKGLALVRAGEVINVIMFVMN